MMVVEATQSVLGRTASTLSHNILKSTSAPTDCADSGEQAKEEVIDICCPLAKEAMGGQEDHTDTNGSPLDECGGNLVAQGGCRETKQKKFLEPFVHQVGGHVGLLYWNSETVCKPYSVRESEFYSRVPPPFRQYLPKYCGVVEVRFVEDGSGYLLLVAKSTRTPPQSLIGEAKTTATIPAATLSTDVACDITTRTTTNSGSSKSINAITTDSSSSSPSGTPRDAITTTTQQSASHTAAAGNNTPLQPVEIDVEWAAAGIQKKKKKHHHHHHSAQLQHHIHRRSFHTTKHRFRLKRSGSLELESVEQGGNAESETPNHELFWDLSSETYAAQNPWAAQCQTRHFAKLRAIQKKKHRFVLLENLVGRYALPCIVDLKMGTQQHGDHAPPEKRANQMRKCQLSTSAKLGVRVVGMQVWNGAAGVYNCLTKYKGRELTEDGLRENLRQFLDPIPSRSVRVDLCRRFIARINKLYKLVNESDGYRFYSSSLLMMYDGATTGQQSNPSCGGCQAQTSVVGKLDADIRMIDFEHSTFPGYLKDPPHVGVDQGYLLGLRTLATIIGEIAADNSDDVADTLFDGAVE